MPICREHVLAAMSELLAVHDRLLAGGPVSAHGVALLRALISDGAGPLYRRHRRDDLGARLRHVLAALDDV